MVQRADVHFRLKDEWKNRLEAVAEAHSMNQSSIMRRGTIEQIKQLEDDKNV